MLRKIKITKNPNRLQRAVIAYLQENPDLTYREWAKKAAISDGTIRNFLTRDSASMAVSTLQKLAAAAGLTVEQLRSFPSERTVELVGFIGAGAIVMYSNEPSGEAHEKIAAPPGLDNPESTVALEIRGDSMLPLENGWRVFYRKGHDGILAEDIGKLCVIQLADGNTLLKKLRKGYAPERYNLESWNAALMEDQEVRWASPVLSIAPR